MPSSSSESERSRSDRGGREDKKDSKGQKSKKESKSEGDRIIAALNASLGGQISNLNKNFENFVTETRQEFVQVKQSVEDIQGKQQHDSDRIDRRRSTAWLLHDKT